MKFGDLVKRVISEEKRESLNPTSKKRKVLIRIDQKYNDEFEVRIFKTHSGFYMGGGRICYNEESQKWNFHISLNSNFIGVGYGPLIYDIILEFVKNKFIVLIFWLSYNFAENYFSIFCYRY